MPLLSSVDIGRPKGECESLPAIVNRFGSSAIAGRREMYCWYVPLLLGFHSCLGVSSFVIPGDFSTVGEIIGLSLSLRGCVASDVLIALCLVWADSNRNITFCSIRSGCGAVLLQLLGEGNRLSEKLSTGWRCGTPTIIVG